MMQRKMGVEEGNREAATWTTREAAENWGVTPGRVKQWIYEERLKAYKRGGRLFIPKGQQRPKDLRPHKK